MKAVVTVETIRTTTNGETHISESTGTYSLSAASAGADLVVTEEGHRTLNLTFDGQAFSVSRQLQAPHGFMALAPLRQKTYWGSYLASKEGPFIELYRFSETYCGRLALLFRGDEAKRAEDMARCRKQLDDKSNPILMYKYWDAHGRASSDWMRMVGWWSGRDMVERKTYIQRTILASAGTTPEWRIPATNESRLVGRFPCGPLEPDDDCVRLEWIAIRDTGPDLQPILEILDTVDPDLWPGRRSINPPVHPVLGSLRQRIVTRILTDPRTLLPRWIEEVDDLWATIGTDTNRHLTGRRIQTTWTYDYEP